MIIAVCIAKYDITRAKSDFSHLISFSLVLFIASLFCRFLFGALVSAYYFHNERMSYDVRRGKVDYTYSVYVFKYRRCVFKSALFALGQIYLRKIARYYHFTAVAHTSQEHFHLLFRRVLRFV